MGIKESVTVIYEKGQCFSDPLDKSQFKTEPLPMIHIISKDEHDEDKVIVEVLTYVQKELGFQVRYCSRNATACDGSGVGVTATGFETNIQISLR